MSHFVEGVSRGAAPAASAVAHAILIRRRWRMSGLLCLLMLGAYFGFILTLAFQPALLATAVQGATLTWGILAGFGLFMLTFLIVATYVSWANYALDPAIAQLQKTGGQS